MRFLRGGSTGPDSVSTTQTHRTGGTASAVAGVGVVLVFLAGPLLRGELPPPWGVTAAALALLLIWVVLLRPAVVVGPEGIVLRNGLSVADVPYARIRRIAVQQFTVVEVDPPGGTAEDPALALTCNGLGRSRSRMRRDAAGPQRVDRVSLAALLEDRIARRAKDARRLADDPRPVEVERTTWLVVALPGLALATVVLALL